MTEPKPEQGQRIMKLFLDEVERRLTETPEDLKAADFEMVRKLLSDNAVTIASVQRGDYGDFARGVAEEFPFSGDEDESGRAFQ